MDEIHEPGGEKFRSDGLPWSCSGTLATHLFGGSARGVEEDRGPDGGAWRRGSPGWSGALGRGGPRSCSATEIAAWFSGVFRDADRLSSVVRPGGKILSIRPDQPPRSSCA